MGFTPVDPAAWERAEYFACFGTTAVYMTVQVDITRLLEEVRRRGLRLYPSLVYCAARVINGRRSFATAGTPRGRSACGT